LRATASRYRPAGRFAFHYVTGKLRRDPVARVLFDLGAKRGFGDVVDLGCGRGHFSACLLQIGAARAVIGIDCHAAHVRQATEAMRGQAFTGRVQDFSVDQAVPAADTVLLMFCISLARRRNRRCCATPRGRPGNCSLSAPPTPGEGCEVA
jgi:methylase of polypeptide subunit release factors